LEGADGGGDVAEIHILGVAVQLGAIDGHCARVGVRRQRQVASAAHGGVGAAHGRHILNLQEIHTILGDNIIVNLQLFNGGVVGRADADDPCGSYLYRSHGVDADSAGCRDVNCRCGVDVQDGGQTCGGDVHIAAVQI
jgi:hypothetical protein